MKKEFPLRTKVQFINLGGDCLEGKTGWVLGKSLVHVDDFYIVMLEEPTPTHLAICMTEHCLEQVDKNLTAG